MDYTPIGGDYYWIMDWFKEVNVKGKQFLVCMNYSDCTLIVETQNEEGYYFTANLSFEGDYEDMKRYYDEIDENDVWEAYKIVKSQLN